MNLSSSEYVKDLTSIKTIQEDKAVQEVYIYQEVLLLASTVSINRKLNYFMKNSLLIVYQVRALKLKEIF